MPSPKTKTTAVVANSEVAAGSTNGIDPGGVFERFFRLIHDLACIASLDGHFKRVNNAFEVVLGYTQEEMLSAPINSWIHPDDVDATWKEVARQLRGENTDGFINRYRHKDGSYRYLEWSTTPASESMLFAVARDVTDRLRLEEEHRLDDLRVQVVMRLCEMSGRSVKEVLGITVAEATVFSQSSYGYLYLYDHERRELSFHYGYGDLFRSAKVKRSCRLDDTGVWGQALRLGRPVVAEGLVLGDLPDPELAIAEAPRLLSIPIALGPEPQALLAVGGKATPYTENDVKQLTLLMNAIWKRLLQRQAEQELRLSHERLRLLAAHLERVREEERLRISREVHDELGQMLTGLKFDLYGIRSAWPGEVSGKLDAMDERISSIIHAVQRISSELRPRLLDNLGLVPALERHFSDFASRTGISCSREIAPLAVSAPECSIALFRIFQEAITNIERHSGATDVSLKLRQENGGIQLTVTDNGKGITNRELHAETSFGLMGMRERASLCGGRVQMKSAAGKGTMVTVWLPIG